MKFKSLSAFIVLMVLTMSVLADAEDVLKEKRKSAFDEMDSKLTLYFKDALTGKGIYGGVFTIEGKTGTTDQSGKVSLPFDGFSQMEKVYTGMFKKNGYITSKVTIRVMAGGIFNSHYSISPILQGKLRIIIDWGKAPADLDAHFVKKDLYHISYHNLKSFEDQALLDKDARNGFGPETITVLKLDETGVYTYFVHDYSNKDKSNSDALGKSRAHVKVYNENELIYEYFMKGGKGTMWKVFTIDQGVFQEENVVN